MNLLKLPSHVKIPEFGAQCSGGCGTQCMFPFAMQAAMPKEIAPVAAADDDDGGAPAEGWEALGSGMGVPLHVPKDGGESGGGGEGASGADAAMASFNPFDDVLSAAEFDNAVAEHTNERALTEVGTAASVAEVSLDLPDAADGEKKEEKPPGPFACVVCGRWFCADCTPGHLTLRDQKLERTTLAWHYVRVKQERRRRRRRRRMQLFRRHACVPLSNAALSVRACARVRVRACVCVYARACACACALPIYLTCVLPPPSPPPPSPPTPSPPPSPPPPSPPPSPPPRVTVPIFCVCACA